MNDSSRKYQITAILILILGIIGVGMLTTIRRDAALAGNFNPTGAGTYTLLSSATKSATTISLTSFTEPSSNIPYTMTYLNSSIEYGTISPTTGSIDNSEFISFTGITQNTNGTATLTGVTRGLSRTPGTGGCVASSTLAHAYPSQTKFILSNSPCFYGEYAVKQNNENIYGLWTFSSTSPPKYDQDPTATQYAGFSSSTFVSYHLLQTTSFSGTTNASITAKGISQLASSTQAASSTDIGTTGAEQVLMAKYATDTPQNCTGLKSGGCVVMSNLLAKISQAWLNLTDNFTFGGAVTVNGTSTAIYSATTSWNGTNPILAISTSTPAIGRGIADSFGGYFAQSVGIGLATSTTNPNLVVAGQASTTDLTISRTCVGCLNSYEQITNTVTGPTSAGAAASQTATCTGSKKVIGGGVGSNDAAGKVFAQISSPSGTNAWTATMACYAGSGGCAANTVTVYAICVNP